MTSVLGKYKWEFKWVLQEHNQAITQPWCPSFIPTFFSNYEEYF